MINRLIIPALSWLLHHANRITKAEEFYKIKNTILCKYAQNDGYDVQYFEGKRCRSCGGKGYHPRYDSHGFVYDHADCYHCCCGWYKLPCWVILERKKLGKYLFHQPLKRVEKKDEAMAYTNSNVIEGYIDNRPSKYGEFALAVLYLLYDTKPFLKRYWKALGRSWHCKWYLPKNWIQTIAHFIRYKHKAFPLERYKRRNRYKPYVPIPVSDDDLPF